MKRNIISILLGSVIGVALGITALHHQEPTVVYATSSINWDAEESEPEVKSERHLTYAEKLLLAACVYAEANTEDLTGKRYVVDVILNRLDSDKFPNTISGVIFEKGQFWTQGMPTDYSQIPQECFDAIEMEMESQLTYEAVYFRNGRYHNFGTPLFSHGRHFFNK